MKIVTSPNVITFSQNLGSNQLKVPEIAGKYIEKYPEADYGKINIIFRRILSLPGGSDQARKYIKKNLLANGPWLEFGNNVGVGINFFFQLERCQLKLSINEANLKYQKRPASPALFFSGNFNYKLESYRKQERLLMLGEIIKNWQQDEKTFREIINQSF
ncbi:MAG: hypothetical protein DSM107014_10595 [Gomphosphaeria aponina SAG 52.96 = DSM 107014]|uniref:Uncharacterized protein n=1 Tax=Gomphosphaeria aponina SAG 52.96 = DSM 107014 TaxID=1521640 RepID=A0A941JSF1_9CHRO|nr:hypothetical protein [Gomphosphaeria aponina SAG 52.96 = DSM 107014]